MRRLTTILPTALLGLSAILLAPVLVQAVLPASSEARSTAGPVRWSIQTHPALLAGFPAEESRRQAIDGRTIRRTLEDESFVGKVESFLQTAQKRGISEVIVSGVQPELKGLYFRSPLLEGKGWEVLYDVFEILREKSGPTGLEIGIDLSELGVHARGLYGSEFGLDRIESMEAGRWDELAGDLRSRYDLSTIGDEEFPADWFPVVRSAAERHGLRYLRRVGPDDILSWTGAGQWASPMEVLSGLRWVSSRDYHRLVHPDRSDGVASASLPLLLPGARPVVHSSPIYSGNLFLQNLILFRSLASAPPEFSMLLGPRQLEELPLELIPRARVWRGYHDPDLPLLNLIVLGEPKTRLDAGHVGWLHLAANLEPVLLGAGAAGFRTQLGGHPLPEADAYYVYLAGAELSEWLEVEKVLSSLSERPVLVQPGAEISESVRWRVLSFLGIPEAEWREEDPPSKGLYAGRGVRFRGVDLYRGNVPSGFYFFEGPLEHVLMADETVRPLLYRNPAHLQRFFVNGSLLHREMSFPVSQLLTDGRGLQRPADCAVAVGHRTVFWALQDTEVDWVDPRTGTRLVLEMRRDGLHLE